MKVNNSQIITIGRFARWSLTILKNTFLGHQLYYIADQRHAVSSLTTYG